MNPKANSNSCGARCTKTSSKLTESTPQKANKVFPATDLTWGGSLVDDFISILLRDDRVAHSKQGKELLYARGCRLKAEAPVNQSPNLKCTVDSNHPLL